MKSPKWVLASVALCMSLAAFSQTDSTRKDSTSRRDTTTQRRDTASASMQTNTTTSDASQSSTSSSASSMNQPQTGSNQSQSATGKQSFPKPNFGRYYIPVLGSYQSQTASTTTASTTTASTTSTASTSTSDQGKMVTVSADETNAGKIWIEGLTPVKFYALLKTAPGTYKIPAQKQEDKSIQEGTVSYDDASKQINICLGCGFQADKMSDMSATNETASETSVKSKNSKTKTKAKTIISFSGVKSGEQTASIR